ncbi:MAG: tetraacyldisaccharide 4'-kinase [Flavobacteriaceae bacterium]|nr:tetraacyldisaccharide 4'-kinase [Flavobacteriaceae bacterium]
MKIRMLLWPLSLLYAWVLRLRHLFYDLGLFKSESFNTPTICVGNLSLGGTGKTPMIALLIEYYLSKGLQIAVVSRGYGRKSRGLIEASAASNANEIGDEAFQLYKSFPQIRMVVCASRVAAMTYLEASYTQGFSGKEHLFETQNSRSHYAPDLVLLDDAFQHRAIKAQFNILLTTYNKPYFKDFYLPAGTLRDHQLRVKKAQVVVITKSPDHLNATNKASFVSDLNLMPNQPVFFSHLKYDNLLIGLNNSISLNTLKGEEVTLVTAIANPEPLVSFLEKQGIIIHHLRFADHHYFSKSEIESLKKHQKIICTHKDFVKLSAAIPQLFYLPVSHDFSEDCKGLFYTCLPEVFKEVIILNNSSSS